MPFLKSGWPHTLTGFLLSVKVQTSQEQVVRINSRETHPGVQAWTSIFGSTTFTELVGAHRGSAERGPGISVENTCLRSQHICSDLILPYWLP